MNRLSSYDELHRQFDRLMSRKQYKKAWNLCQKYSLSKVLNDFSFTFSIDGAKSGLLAAKAAEMAGVPERSYVESSISALIIKNELEHPTTHKDKSRIDNLRKDLSDANTISHDAFHKMTDQNRLTSKNEVDQIRARFERHKNSNLRLSALVDEKLNMTFIQRWLIRRRIKKMYKQRQL